MASKYNRPIALVEGQKTGYAPLIHIADFEEMNVVGEPVSSPPDIEDTFMITTDHTFNAGSPTKGFMQLYTIGNDNTVTGNSHGSAGASNGTYEIKAFVPGDGPATQALVENLRNKSLMVLVDNPEEPDGTRLQFGSKKLPVFLMPGFESGQLQDGRKGYTLTFTSVNRFFYTGTVTVMA